MGEQDQTTDRDVELVRRHYAAYDRGDIDGMIATLHPDAEIVSYDERGRHERVWRGRSAARGLFVEIHMLVADIRAEILSLKSRPGHVEVTLGLHGTRRDTGASGPIPAVHVHEIRDGLIARIETYRPDWRS